MSEAQRLAEMTVAFFNGAQRDKDLCDRMTFADTVIHIEFADPDDTAAFTVWLDCSPIRAEMGIVGNAEIFMSGPSAIFAKMIGGTEDMAMAIARGEVVYEGPVRKFLRIVPIMQAFDFKVYRPPADAYSVAAPSQDGSSQPSGRPPGQ